MNPQSFDVLKSIYAKELTELTESDIAFLRARKVYVESNPEMLAKFASVFGDPVPVAPVPEVVPEIIAAPVPEAEVPVATQEVQADPFNDGGAADPDYKG